MILSKLEFYQEGGSEKHVRDISSILRAPEASIDQSYLDFWADQLGVLAEWMADKARVARA